MEVANDTDYGLAATVFSEDVPVALYPGRVRRRLLMGVDYIRDVLLEIRVVLVTVSRHEMLLCRGQHIVPFADHLHRAGVARNACAVEYSPAHGLPFRDRGIPSLRFPPC